MANNNNILARLGTGLGQGVSQGLEQLTQHKLNQIKASNLTQMLQKLNVPAQEANLIPHLSPKAQEQYFAEVFNRGGFQPQQQQGQLNQVLDALSSPQQQVQQLQGQPLQEAQAQRATSQPVQQRVSPLSQPSPKDLEKQQQFAEKQQLARQKNINTATAPFMKKSSAAVSNAEAILREAERLKELKATGNVSNGLAGRRPLFLQSTESEQYEKSGNALAQMLAASGTGVPTGFRIKFAQSQKPGLGMQSKTQDELTDRIIEEAEQVIAKGEIRDHLIEENGFEIPANLETLVNKRWKEYQDNPMRLVNDIQERQNKPEEEQIQRQAPANPEEFDTTGESPLGTGVRRVVSGAARVGESLLGAPGDIASLGLALGNWATGGKIPSYGELQEKTPVSLPTSQQLQEATGRATKGYTNPQGEIEKSIDNVVGTIASLFLPNKIKPGMINTLSKIFKPGVAAKTASVLMPFSGVPWKRALGMGVAGELGARTAEASGGGALAQAGTKLAFMTLAGVRGTRGAIQEAEKAAYARRDATIGGPLSAKNTIAVDKTLAKVKNFAEKIGRGSEPDKDLILDIAKQVESGLEKSKTIASKQGFPGKASVKDVLEQDKSLNKWFGLATKPRVSGEQVLPKTARGEIAQLGRILDEPLSEFGHKVPEFGFNHAFANDLHKGLAYADQAHSLFKGGSFMSSNLTSFAAKILLKGAGNAGAQKIAEAWRLIKDSPQAARLYKEAMLNAAEGNILAASQAAAKLDKVAKHYEEKNAMQE